MFREEEVLPILREARKLIAPRRRWTHGAFSRTLLGFHTRPVGEKAQRWCAMGAIHKAVGYDYADSCEPYAKVLLVDRAGDLLAKYGFFGRFVPSANDTGKHKEVLRGFDRAIERLETIVEARRQAEERAAQQKFLEANARLNALVRESEERDRDIRLAQFEKELAEMRDEERELIKL